LINSSVDLRKLTGSGNLDNKNQATKHKEVYYLDDSIKP
jgi:hypothetical protein